jgi:nucleotide-binding universal stress UspA family protein
MSLDAVRRVMLHGSMDEWFAGAVRFAARLTRGFDAELHVVYTIGDPLSAGWTAEMAASRLPELHRAMEEEARNRLAAVLPPDQQDSVVIAIRTDDPGDELVRYTAENDIDLAVVQARDDASRALIERGTTSVLLMR